MKHTKILAAALMLWPALCLAAAPPAEIRYDYVDLGVTFGEIDTVGDDVDYTSFDVTGSWGFHPNVALIGRAGFGEIDVAGDIDTTELAIGVNPHFPLARNIDLVLPIAVEWAEFDSDFVDDDDTGYSLGAGVRALLNPALELSGGVRYLDIFDSDDLAVVGGVRWHISQLISLSLDANIGDDDTGFRLGGRFSF